MRKEVKQGVGVTLIRHPPFNATTHKTPIVYFFYCSIAIGRAEALVDCSADQAIAWFFRYESHERTLLDTSSSARVIVEDENDEGVNFHAKTIDVVKKLLFPFSYRDFCNKTIVKKHSEGCYSLCASPCDKMVDYGVKTTFKGTVKGTVKAYFTMTSIENIGEIGLRAKRQANNAISSNKNRASSYFRTPPPPSVNTAIIFIPHPNPFCDSLRSSQGKIKRCKVVLHQHIDVRGHIPKVVMKWKVPDALRICKELKDSVKQDSEVDEGRRESLRNIIENEPQTYSDVEMTILSESKKFAAKNIERLKKRGKLSQTERESIYQRNESSVEVREIKVSDPLTSLKAVQVDGESLVVGIAQATMDADPATCIAHEYLKDTREKLAKLEAKRVIEQHIVKRSDHSQLYFTARNLVLPGISNREVRLHGQRNKLHHVALTILLFTSRSRPLHDSLRSSQFRTKCIWQKDEVGNYWVVYSDTN